MAGVIEHSHPTVPRSALSAAFKNESHSYQQPWSIKVDKWLHLFNTAMGRKITSLKVQKRNRERVNVYLDGEFSFGLSRIVAAWLQVGHELDDEKIEALQAEDEQEVAYQRGLNFISFRDRSENEIRKYLLDKDTPPATIEHVVERLQRSGLLNDQRFAKRWVENRSEYRPRGRRALAYELRRKGISKEAIDSAVALIDEDALAYEAARKQSRKYRNLEWPEYRKKMVGFLARRGFNYEISASAAERVWTEGNDGEPPNETFR